MNLLLTMKRGQGFLALMLLVLSWTVPAGAGQWELDGYYWSGTSESVKLFWFNKDRGGGEDYGSRKQTEKIVVRNRNAQSSHETPYFAIVTASGLSLQGESVPEDGIATGKGSVASSVYARFIWRRGTARQYDESGSYTYVPDPDDNPPKYVYVREIASVSAATDIHQVDGNGTGYNSLNRWQGDYFEVTGNSMGLELGDAYRPDSNKYSSWAYGPNSKTKVRRVETSGDQVIVPSRTFAGTIQLSPGYEKEAYDRVVSGNMLFGYSAEPLNFALNVSAPAVANREQKKPDTEEIDALVGLRWLHPENIGTGEDEDPIKPSRSAAKRYWDGFILGDGQIDDGAPIPYFAGQATFSVTATGSDGRTPIFNGQTYKWTPEDNKDPFDPDDNGTPGPGFVATSDTQRTYVWNFGSAQEGDGNFPQTTDVTVEVSSADGDGETLEETKTINWHSTWSPTETGLQKNVVTSKFGRYVRPDGSPVAISDVKPGDTILCFVEGDSGFSTDGNRLEKIRPVPHEHQVPGPGERIEPRVVGQIVPSGDNNQIIIFNSTPQVRPDDDEDAAGFDEIQKIKEIAATSEHAYQTGKSLTTTALTIQLELMKAAAFGPAEGVAIATAFKGLVAVGRLAEAAKGLRAGIKVSEKGAEEARLAAKGFEAMKARGGLSAKRLKDVDKEIKYYKGLEARHRQLIKDNKSQLNVGERYAAKAAAKFKKAGCFVAGTPVWMSDGNTRPIEQVKVGDTVLSKNEQTGEIAAKRVNNTTVRSAIWTRKLTFENGAVLETTDEHPLYVEGSGFVKAKEVGIGSSIVTRAGPGAKIVAVEADVRQTTVYNFTVDEFHTYFVGQNVSWAHNQNCPPPQAQAVDPNFTHLDQDFAKHMFEGDLEDATSLYSGEWNGKGLHQWEAMERRFVNTNNDTIYAVVKVREDPNTLARSVDVERITTTANGGLNPAGTVARGKTLWPKGMSQQEINGVSNQAFSDALSYNGTNGNSFVDVIGEPRGKFTGMGIAPNGHLMPVEGYYKIVTTNAGTTRIPVNCWPQGGNSWPVIPHTAY